MLLSLDSDMESCKFFPEQSKENETNDLLLHKYEGFEKDCFLHKHLGKRKYLFTIYQHNNDYFCHCESKNVLKDGHYLRLMVMMPHEHYLVWFKEERKEGKTNASNVYNYKFMTQFQQLWIEWLLECLGCVEHWGLLFNYEKEVFRKSSWMNFKLVQINGVDWVKEFECFGLFGVC